MDIGMPKISIVFNGLGASAVKRGEKGVAVLILKDKVEYAEYKDISKFTSSEQAKYTPENVQYIKDALEGAPLILKVFCMKDNLMEIMANVKSKAPRNCWIAIADATKEETAEFVTFIKTAIKNNKKRYKAIVFGNKADDMHVINFTNSKVVFADARKEQPGIKAVPYLLGMLAGLSLDMSAIALTLSKFDSVTEPADLETSINSGEFVLYNEENEVKVARGVNSLVTTGQGITDDMKFILIIEVMDLIYTDILSTWAKFYKGKYKNSLDNQMLLIAAINAYYKALARDLILDPKFINKAQIDCESQRLANSLKYGEEVVTQWEDAKVEQMTVGTNVFLSSNIKILNAMEDFSITIDM